MIQPSPRRIVEAIAPSFDLGQVFQNSLQAVSLLGGDAIKAVLPQPIVHPAIIGRADRPDAFSWPRPGRSEARDQRRAGPQ